LSDEGGDALALAFAARRRKKVVVSPWRELAS
jgi:hypothetical protein